MVETAVSSKDYSPGLSVYTLVVLTSGDRHKKDVGIIDFDPKDIEGRPFGEIPHKVMYVCPRYVNTASLKIRSSISPVLTFFAKAEIISTIVKSEMTIIGFSELIRSLSWSVPFSS